MSKLLSVLIVIAVLTSSCGKEAPPALTQGQIQRRIDSITSERIKEATARAQIILEHRIKIEVKVKADSIVRAMQKKGARAQPESPQLKQQ